MIEISCPHETDKNNLLYVEFYIYDIRAKTAKKLPMAKFQLHCFFPLKILKHIVSYSS